MTRLPWRLRHRSRQPYEPTLEECIAAFVSPTKARRLERKIARHGVKRKPNNQHQDRPPARLTS